MKQILMILFKDIDYDARVQREAIALAESGYRVLICCLNEYDTDPPFLHELFRFISYQFQRSKQRKEWLMDHLRNLQC